MIHIVLGQELATLFEGIHQPGNYEAIFSARGGFASGGDGSELASGVYFYTIKVKE
jgi:hypothetical protein